MRSKLVHRADGDFPVAWATSYGKCRVVCAPLGHDAAYWGDPALSTMYCGAITWALKLTEAHATPGLKVSR